MCLGHARGKGADALFPARGRVRPAADRGTPRFGVCWTRITDAASARLSSPTSGAGSGQRLAGAGVIPNPGQIRAKSGPNPGQIRARSGPDSGQIRARSRSPARSGPGPDRGWCLPKPLLPRVLLSPSVLFLRCFSEASLRLRRPKGSIGASRSPVSMATQASPPPSGAAPSPAGGADGPASPAGVARGPPLDTATIAGRNTRSPMV